MENQLKHLKREQGKWNFIMVRWEFTSTYDNMIISGAIVKPWDKKELAPAGGWACMTYDTFREYVLNLGLEFMGGNNHEQYYELTL